MGSLIWGLSVWLLCLIWRKKTVFRKFGGSFDLTYRRFPLPVRWLLRKTVLQMNLILLQTHHLVSFFRELTGKPTVWFPTSRPLSDLTPRPCEPFDGGARRFVYVGQVKTTKGIRDIIDATVSLDEGIVVDVYGPLIGDIRPEAFVSAAQYCGVVEPDDVPQLLRHYDVLLLPTYHEGEGYPGAILEAYAAGLPVIATRWSAIPEIVDDTTGILIAPRDAEGLRRAICELAHAHELYYRLHEGALHAAKKFSSEYWCDRFVALARGLLAEDIHEQA